MSDTQTHQVKLSTADTQRGQAVAAQLGFPDISTLLSKGGPAVVSILEILLKTFNIGGGGQPPTTTRQH